MPSKSPSATLLLPRWLNPSRDEAVVAEANIAAAASAAVKFDRFEVTERIECMVGEVDDEVDEGECKNEPMNFGAAGFAGWDEKAGDETDEATGVGTDDFEPCDFDDGVG